MQFDLHAQNFGWIDVWEFISHREGVDLAEGLCDMYGEWFWMRASTAGGGECCSFLNFTQAFSLLFLSQGSW
jgi:hypothetical protein